MTRQIKPSTSTQFPVGSKVKVLDSGNCYSGYQQMARYMGVDIRIPFNPFINGEVGVVVAKAMHEDQEREVLAVRVDRGIGLIDVKGVVEHEELKPILFDEMREGQVVRFTKFKGHEHWDFVVGKDYTVEYGEYGYTGHTGPRNPTGSIPSCKWGDWEWVLVSEAPQEPTLDEVKAELATVRAKLWEAEQKLNQIKEIL